MSDNIETAVYKNSIFTLVFIEKRITIIFKLEYIATTEKYFLYFIVWLDGFLFPFFIYCLFFTAIIIPTLDIYVSL